MNRILAIFLCAVATLASAQTVSPSPLPEGAYQLAAVSLPNGGVLAWNSAGVDSGKLPYASGNCADVMTSPAPPGLPRLVGLNCSGPATAFVTTTGHLSATCPADGATLEAVRLTLSLNGVVFYDAPRFTPSQTPCYTTPAPLAVKSFVNPVITFDNSANNRPSASTSIYVRDFLFSKFNFDGAPFTCGRWLAKLGPRWSSVYTEIGFTCTAVVPAGQVQTFTITPR